MLKGVRGTPLSKLAQACGGKHSAWAQHGLSMGKREQCTDSAALCKPGQPATCKLCCWLRDCNCSCSQCLLIGCTTGSILSRAKCTARLLKLVFCKAPGNRHVQVAVGSDTTLVIKQGTLKSRQLCPRFGLQSLLQVNLLVSCTGAGGPDASQNLPCDLVLPDLTASRQAMYDT